MDAFQAQGSRIIGLRIETRNLKRAHSHIQRAYDSKLEIYPASLGEAFIAPTLDELGLVLEFHSGNFPKRSQQ